MENKEETKPTVSENVNNSKKIVCKISQTGCAYDLLNVLNAILERHKRLPTNKAPLSYDSLKRFKMTCIIEEL